MPLTYPLRKFYIVSSLLFLKLFFTYLIKKHLFVMHTKISSKKLSVRSFVKFVQGHRLLLYETITSEVFYCTYFDFFTGSKWNIRVQLK